MAEYILKGPDGKEYVLGAPEGATPDQISAIGKQAMERITAAQPPTLAQRALKFGGDILGNYAETGRIAKDVIGGGVVPTMAQAGSSMLQMAGSEYNPLGRMLPEPVRQAMTEQGKEASRVATDIYEQAGPGALVGRILPEAIGAGKLFTPVKAGVEAAIRHAPQVLQKVLGTTPKAIPAAAGTTVAGSKLAPYVAAAGAEGPTAAFFDPEEAASSAVIAALVSPAVLRATRALAHGAPRAADVDILTSEGVPLTVGQAADKRTYSGRVLKRFEEGLTKLPLVGDMIRLRQQEALDAARQAAVKRGEVPEELLARNVSQAGPVKPAPPVDKSGMSIDQLIENQAKDYARAYSDAIKGKTIRADAQGFKTISDIIESPDLAITDPERNMFRNMVRRRLIETLEHSGAAGKTPKNFNQVINVKANQMPWWDAETLMKNQSSFRKVGYKWAQSQDPARRDMGFALRDIADEIYEVIGRQDVEAGKLLENLRAPYSSHRTVAAASARAPKIGEFTMPQLAKQAQRSGNEWLETFARQGSEHLPVSIPTGDSSTSMLMSIIGAAVAPKLMAGAGVAGATFGSKTGQKLLQGQMGWQHNLADQLRKIGVD